MTKSTLAEIQRDLEALEETLAVLLSGKTTITRVDPQKDLRALQERVRTLQEGMKLEMSPVGPLYVALDYGMERAWPDDAVQAVARVLPEMRITTE